MPKNEQALSLDGIDEKDIIVLAHHVEAGMLAITKAHYQAYQKMNEERITKLIKGELEEKSKNPLFFLLGNPAQIINDTITEVTVSQMIKISDYISLSEDDFNRIKADRDRDRDRDTMESLDDHDDHDCDNCESSGNCPVEGLMRAANGNK